MREDIYGGLKNAMERGATLDEAVSSFINSGYPSGEVHEAAGALNAGATYNIRPSSQTQQRPSSQVQQQPLPPQQQQRPQQLPPSQPQQVKPAQMQNSARPGQQEASLNFRRSPEQQTAFMQRLGQLRQNIQQSNNQNPQQRPQQVRPLPQQTQQRPSSQVQQQPLPPQQQQRPSPPMQQIQQPQPQPIQQQYYQQPQLAPRRKMDFILLILVLILIASIGFFVASLLFKQQIAEFLKNILT
jgi:hypothetical protein